MSPWANPRDRSAAALAGGVDASGDGVEVGGMLAEGNDDGTPRVRPLSGPTEGAGLDVGRLGD